MVKRLLLCLCLLSGAWPAIGSAESVVVATVTRPPFSLPEAGGDTGFSLELLDALTGRLGWELSLRRHEAFADMLEDAENGTADLAIANISITAARESRMDFSQPIFESGLQMMVPASDIRAPSLWRAVFSPDLGIAVGAAFLLLFGGGMMMWALERRAQPYFDRPLKEAWFPSFWWALNLVVNGGFEERVPRTPIGRIFGVILVVSSLFIVSVFVAKITAVMTVEAITGSVNSVNDLYGERVGTIAESTAAGFLDRREIDYRAFDGLAPLLRAFEEGAVRVVVFDAPVLSYYTAHEGSAFGRMAGQVFLKENYGIAIPAGSPLVEEVNRALLTLREDGTYEAIRRRWFGSG